MWEPLYSGYRILLMRDHQGLIPPLLYFGPGHGCSQGAPEQAGVEGLSPPNPLVLSVATISSFLVCLRLDSCLDYLWCERNSQNRCFRQLPNALLTLAANGGLKYRSTFTHYVCDIQTDTCVSYQPVAGRTDQTNYH